MDAEGIFQNSIDELDNLDSGRFENIFRVFLKSEKYFYNILRTINIDLSDADPNTYSVSSLKVESSWTNISYRTYGTTDLWWVIYITNKDKFNNPVQLVPGGTELRIVKTTFLRSIVDEINQELKPKI